MEKMERCRGCLSEKLFMCLPMGDHPPANQFLSKEQLKNVAEAEMRAPLNTHACLSCGLIQVPDNVPAGFFRNYVYVPSASATMHRHFAAFAEKMVKDYLPNGQGLVCDIGCNDGLFLGACMERGARVLGIDPADNITARARAKGIEVVPEYFGEQTAKKVLETHPKADIITTTNTFNHIGDLHDFMKGVATYLADDGMFVVEVPTALDLVQKNEFDTIYHEHTSEFSVKSFVDLYRYFDMTVFNIDPLPIHGGSMRVYGQKATGARQRQPIVDEWLAREDEAELFSQKTYEAFADRVQKIRTELMTLLHQLKADGKKLAGYGAPAKGNTLLNYYGIGPELLDFLADRNELKQNLFSPGMHIPVVAPSEIAVQKPDYLLILAWNFADEIIAEQADFRKAGGRFIIPIPEPKIIE